jgi:hypothetical protein
MIKTETVLNGTNYKVSMQKIYLNYADILQNKNGRSAIELGLQQQHDNGAYVDFHDMKIHIQCRWARFYNID